LKRSYQRGGNQEAGNWSLRTDIMQHWKSNVTTAFRRLSSSSLDDGQRELFTRFLFRIILGIRSESQRNPHDDLDLDEKRKLLHSLFTPSLREELNFKSTQNSFRIPSKTRIWKFPRDSHTYQRYINHGLTNSTLRDALKRLLATNFTNPQLMTARFAPCVSSGPERFSTLQKGNLFRTACTNTDGSITQRTWSFFYAVAVQERGIYIISKVCNRDRSNTLFTTLPLMTPASFELIPLDHTVRRVAHYHYCDKNCSYDISADKIIHATTVEEGGVFVIQGREEGYPPRRG